MKALKMLLAALVITLCGSAVAMNSEIKNDSTNTVAPHKQIIYYGLLNRLFDWKTCLVHLVGYDSFEKTNVSIAERLQKTVEAIRSSKNDTVIEEEYAVVRLALKLWCDHRSKTGWNYKITEHDFASQLLELEQTRSSVQKDIARLKGEIKSKL